MWGYLLTPSCQDLSARTSNCYFGLSECLKTVSRLFAATFEFKLGCAQRHVLYPRHYHDEQTFCCCFFLFLGNPSGLCKLVTIAQCLLGSFAHRKEIVVSTNGHRSSRFVSLNLCIRLVASVVLCTFPAKCSFGPKHFAFEIETRHFVPVC